jgi:ABC-type multidrug transport system fused ATPase/permease subunit
MFCIERRRLCPRPRPETFRGLGTTHSEIENSLFNGKLRLYSSIFEFVLPVSMAKDAGRALEERASCLSRLFLSWFTDLMNVGSKKVLEQEDLGGLAKIDESEFNYCKLMELWDEEVNQKGLEKALLIRVWFRFVGFFTLAQLLLFAVLDFSFQIASPLLCRQIVRHVEGTEIQSQASLLIMAICLALCPMLSGFFRAHTILLSKRRALQLYAALTTAIYRKTIRLSARGKSTVETGQIINMLSADANNSIERSVFMIIPMIVSVPVIVVILALIYNTIGASMFAGFGALLVALPVSAMIFANIVKWVRQITVRGDKRVKILNELISGIRIVKFYAWERPFHALIEKARAYELYAIRKHAYWMQCGIMVVFMQLPNLMQLCVFVAYSLSGGYFSASNVFTTLQLFNVVRGPVTQFPSGLSQLANLVVAMRRIGNFLKRGERAKSLDEHRSFSKEKVPVGKACITVKNGRFSWVLGSKTATEQPGITECEEVDSQGTGVELKAANLVAENKTSNFSLSDVDFEIMSGELVMVVGLVGSGKSSLISALLNEIPQECGSISVQGKTSLIAQNAWITNQTLRNNILFGEEFDQKRYNEVIDVCGLEQDVEGFEDRDQIMIGERGINLSGGQKTRVGLARACYSKSDIVLLDSPLAAVDSHVADHIFNKCIKRFLKGRTRIFVTNQIQRLKHADKVLVLKDGKLACCGTYDHIRDNFSEELDALGSIEENSTGRRRLSSVGSEDSLDLDENKRNSAEVSEYNEDFQKGKALHTKEEREMGRVSTDVWRYFFRAAGYWNAFFAIAALSSFTYFQVAVSFMLQYWTNDVVSRKYTVGDLVSVGNSSTTVQSVKDALDRYDEYDKMWLGLYGSSVAVSLIIMLTGGVLMARLRVRVAKALHERMVNELMRTPISFFDVTPAGRIMNRFSKEINSVDTTMTIMIAFTMVTINFCFASFLAIAVATYGLFLVLLVPIWIVFYILIGYIRNTSIEVQRLEAIARSPMYSASTEILGGVETIRAFDQTNRFEQTYRAHLNNQLVPFYFARTLVFAWMMMRANALSSFIVATILALVLWVPDLLPPGNVALAITFGLSCTEMMMHVVQVSVQAEIQMNAVERIKHFSENLPKEKPYVLEDTTPPKEWPSKGEIVFNSVVAGYRDGPDIIKGMSFEIKPKEKIGIVGRTGSGKSSMLVLLFRIIETRSGSVVIDGIDVSTIGLNHLRRNLGIIPQTPTMFSGSLRHNIDPFEEHTDEEIWKVLEKVNLKSVASALPGKLEHMVSEGGANFSVGQRQLLCMARALLLDPKILLLDEATAQVDQMNDSMLQRMIRTCFADKTVLTIAHRLETIMDSDRVMVLDNGHLKEFDSPANLLQKTGDDAVFRALVYAEGDENGRRLEGLANL